jgi:hypothetical protein
MLQRGEVKMHFVSMFIAPIALAMTVNPVSFPLFMRYGFSSVIEFEETPSKIVLGDQSLFQVEKLDRGVVIKPLVTYATTNMFVYFKTKETRLFVLTASEDAEPTFYKKFTTIAAPAPLTKKSISTVKYVRGARIKNSSFDKKKDFLTIDIELSADSSAKVVPNWEQIRLKFKDRFLKPSKLWSERREIQRDSSVKTRLIFAKPNVPYDLREVTVVIPIRGSAKGFTAGLRGGRS